MEELPQSHYKYNMKLFPADENVICIISSCDVIQKDNQVYLRFVFKYGPYVRNNLKIRARFLEYMHPLKEKHRLLDLIYEANGGKNPTYPPQSAGDLEMAKYITLLIKDLFILPRLPVYVKTIRLKLKKNYLRRAKYWTYYYPIVLSNEWKFISLQPDMSYTDKDLELHHDDFIISFGVLQSN